MIQYDIPTRWGSGKCKHEEHIYLEGSKTPQKHSVDVWTPEESSATTSKRFWVIYIHGGAWRSQDKSDFVPTVRNLLSSASLENIAGFASINYRLSIMPSDPETLKDPGHNVQHPAHLSDVLSAIALLNHRYAFGNDYILMGHSAGASLTFQVDQRSWHGPSGWPLPLPAGVLGVEGIYDLEALVDCHKGKPYGEIYEEFVTGAFGSDREDWKFASPTSVVGGKAWMAAKVVALAHSVEDELVEIEQVELMQKVMEGVPDNEARGFGTAWSKEKRHDVYLEMGGKHDETWQTGSMDRAIEKVLALLLK